MSIRVVLIPFVTLLALTLSGIATNPFSPWYLSLRLPDFTPTGRMISIACTIIYITATASALSLFSKKLNRQQRTLFITLFLANACLFVAWNWLFFTFHMIGASVVDTILILATVIAIMVFARRISWYATLLLVPYAIWMYFITYLNLTIWTLNR